MCLAVRLPSGFRVLPRIGVTPSSHWLAWVKLRRQGRCVVLIENDMCRSFVMVVEGWDVPTLVVLRCHLSCVVYSVLPILKQLGPRRVKLGLVILSL